MDICCVAGIPGGVCLIGVFNAEFMNKDLKAENYSLQTKTKFEKRKFTEFRKKIQQKNVIRAFCYIEQGTIKDLDILSIKPVLSILKIRCPN